MDLAFLVGRIFKERPFRDNLKWGFRGVGVAPEGVGAELLAVWMEWLRGLSVMTPVRNLIT
jgi:hypothetical protein